VDKSNKIKAIFFATQAAKSLTPNFNEVYNYYKNTGVDITYTDFFQLPNNFYNFLFTKTPFSKYESLTSNAVEKIDTIVDKFLSGGRNIKKLSNARYYFTKIMYALSYKFYIPGVVNKVTLNNERCTKCNICEKNCPTNSLNINDKTPISKSCIMCQKCMNNCPQNAFMYKNKEFDIYKPIES
jgi:NAD-dependent dihydropyrimidine dehydrogenase PreA subunit